AQASPAPASPPADAAPVAEAAAPRWGGFDLGGAGATSDVTEVPDEAPDPIAAVPILRRSTAVPAPLPEVVPPVTRVPEPPAQEDAPEGEEPWVPGPLRGGARAMDEAFDESSGSVSAIAEAPVAGTPRSATTSVSAQHTRPEIPDELDEQTVVARRRRSGWSLVPPTGPAVAITSDVVILGRRPQRDRQHPQAQLIEIEDETVSKTHARLVLRSEKWFVTDLDSTNGVLFATFMGTDVEAPPGVETEAGEKFLLGDAEIKLVKSEA
ncbi:FHA domain-containing protein, partial [Microbacterium fluvii]